MTSVRYVLLLRGINVGGKNKVVMAELKSALELLGFSNVSSYINSGNLFFESQERHQKIVEKITELFKITYEFELLFIVISAEAFQQEYLNLPAWWQSEYARKDVLFYTDLVDKEQFKLAIEAMSLGEEIIYFGELAVYWAKYSETAYKQTAYAKNLIKTPFYKQVTIRNGNTFEKIKQLLLQ